MRRVIICGWMIFCGTCFCVGCGNEIPEMSEEQQELVVEHAVSEVLKYDKHYKGKLMDMEEVEAQEAAAKAAEDAMLAMYPEPTQDTATLDDDPFNDKQVDVDNTDADELVYTTIEEVLNLDDIQITYTGSEVESFYPKDTEDLYFVMNATDGNSLLILKFLVQNISSADSELDIEGIGARFKIEVNGEAKNALTTMLLNDMAYYKGVIKAGESIELVLVCEVPQEEAISTLNLIVKNVDDIGTILIQ